MSSILSEAIVEGKIVGQGMITCDKSLDEKPNHNGIVTVRRHLLYWKLKK